MSDVRLLCHFPFVILEFSHVHFPHNSKRYDLVQVYYNAQWGTLCHVNWDTNDTMVACRQLGFIKAVGPWRLGRGMGKIWLDNMRCSGLEASLESCPHNEWGSVTSRCNHDEWDAGIVCALIIVLICHTFNCLVMHTVVA